MLLALATQTVINAALLEKGRFYLDIYHPGKPVRVEIRVRSKNKLSESWTYHDDFTHMPKRVKTSPTGRRVFIVLPENIGIYTQACARIAPSKQQQESSSASFGLQACANVAMPKD